MQDNCDPLEPHAHLSHLTPADEPLRGLSTAMCRAVILPPNPGTDAFLDHCVTKFGKRTCK